MVTEHYPIQAGRCAGPKRARNTLGAWLAAIASLLQITACSPSGPSGGGVPFSLRALIDANARHLEEGYHAFSRGDMEAAMVLFRDVATRPGIAPALSLAAYYALACTQLSLARTPEAYAEGIASWLAWWELRSQEAIANEDPRLLAPFFREATLPLLTPPPAPKMIATVCPPDTRAESEALRKELHESNSRIQRIEKESQILRANLGRKEVLIRAFEDQVHQFEEKVKGITEQIQALEQIDQRIEEKKKGITSP